MNMLPDSFYVLQKTASIGRLLGAPVRAASRTWGALGGERRFARGMDALQQRANTDIRSRGLARAPRSGWSFDNGRLTQSPDITDWGQFPAEIKALMQRRDRTTNMRDIGALIAGASGLAVGGGKLLGKKEDESPGVRTAQRFWRPV